jgi:hypothetical protein
MSLEDEITDFRVIEKMFKYTDMRGDNECWNYYNEHPSERGRFYYRGKPEYAYRVMYCIENGPIPPNKVVMHTCDNPMCVNPKHLKLGTHKENIHDAMNKGRRPSKE